MDQIKQNAKWVFLGIGVISFLFFGLLSSISGPMGTSTNGFDVVFNGEGLGFSRILMLFTILAPLCAAVYAFVVPEAKWGKNLLYIFGGGVVLAIITLISFPSMFGFSIGFSFLGWLAILFMAAGAALSFLMNQPAKK